MSLRPRSQSVSVPASQHGTRRNFIRSHSFKSPPNQLGSSPNSFKAYWGDQIGEKNSKSFKERRHEDVGDSDKSYGQTSETIGPSCGQCGKSFKAPADNAGTSQGSFKSSPCLTGNSGRSFKAPRGNFRSLESVKEAPFNDVLHPMRARQSQ